ncbi:MAG TPA: PLP-dependent cysteine synthase family protein [Bacteroidales bacterium]|nr:PLP-dependent cysteine synthase family protein [Bacteroidales bacterium]
MFNFATTANTIFKLQFKHIWQLIGNSPLLVIYFLYKGKKRVIYAKAEHYNITGSIKDRMALYILEKAYAEGRIKKGDTIVEATSGNTGIAFAAIGRALGHPVRIIMPDWMSRERVDIIRSLGAQIIPVSKEQGGFLGSIRISEEIAAGEPNIFLPQQFSNIANAEAHERTTGPEIWFQMQYHGVKPAAFVAGVGTGGTVMGVGKYLRSQDPTIRIHPLEPAESPTLSTGYKVGSHRIQGISDEFIPAIIKLDELDRVVAVPDGDSIIMAQKLAQQIGVAVGISSGANFLGALQIQNEMGGDAAIATVLSDCNKKYLSTDLMRDEPMRDDYQSKHVELTGFNVYKRVCDTCCDMVDCELRPYEYKINS